MLWWFWGFWEAHLEITNLAETLRHGRDEKHAPS